MKALPAGSQASQKAATTENLSSMVSLTVSPTIARIGSYRFFFFAGDFGEPPHVHVERDNAVAKYWLDPVALVTSRFFPPHELRKLHRTVQEHAADFLEAWNGFFRS